MTTFSVGKPKGPVKPEIKVCPPKKKKMSVQLISTASRSILDSVVYDSVQGSCQTTPDNKNVWSEGMTVVSVECGGCRMFGIVAP